MSYKKRRSSIFKQNDANVAYRDKLKQDIEEYLQFFERKESAPQNSSKSDGKLLLEKDEAFLASLPDLEHYVHIIDDFLKKHQVTQNDVNVKPKLEELQHRIFPDL